MMQSICGIGGNCTGFMWHMWIPTLIGWFFVIFVVYTIYWLFSKNGRDISIRKETPLDILKKRYASGEISRKQFEQVKKELG